MRGVGNPCWRSRLTGFKKGYQTSARQESLDKLNKLGSQEPKVKTVSVTIREPFSGKTSHANAPIVGLPLFGSLALGVWLRMLTGKEASLLAVVKNVFSIPLQPSIQTQMITKIAKIGTKPASRANSAWGVEKRVFPVPWK